VAIYDSLHDLPLDALAEKAGGRHRLTVLVAKRIRQINEGAQLLVERLPGEALLAAVCREVLAGKIWLETVETETQAESADEFDLLGLSDDLGAAEN
jgi:DNA-directed RNA polymerase subunit K/omega